MTEQLYLQDSYLQNASAHIVEMGKDYLVLDQTIFYPQGGGQPSDKGIIQSSDAHLKVKSVEYNGGNIKHIGSITGSFEIGQSVELSIDWSLRHKNMQWHTAGHLVDLIVRQMYSQLVPIRGMHGIGKKLFIEYEGIHKLDTVKLNRQLDKLIQTTPIIETRFVTLDELKKIANWLPPKLPSSKKLRILTIGDTYHIPDGGTQLKTGESIWSIEVSIVEQTETTTLVHYKVNQPKIHSDDSNSSSDEIPNKITNLTNSFNSSLNDTNTTQQIDALRIQYLGKSGLTTQLLRELPSLSESDKRKYGPVLNELKSNQESAIQAKSRELAQTQGLPYLDLTTPTAPAPSGRLHPTTVVIRELNEFFRYHGFSVADGPEIETAEYNFRRLNLPEGHPATDLQDTLFIHEPDLLLRTHTSSIQTRILSSHKPPLRVVVPGKVYRNETNSTTNTSFFYQYQGFVVDKGITIGHLKDILTKLHQFLFGSDVKLRFRYKYYPEVSPGMGVDMRCRFCQGSGCQVCKYRGWIETLGSGMTHYNCYKLCGIDPEIYTGYSFGLGLDRLVMSKYQINDIRKLYGGELVYL